MTKIDKDLLEWVISLDDADELRAEKYGDFSVARMDISLFLSEEDIEQFDNAEKYLLDNKHSVPPKQIHNDYYRYIQAHNHELFHYYQAQALPAFQIYQKLSRGKLEYEAATMLSFFEKGHNYVLGENSSIFEALKNTSFNNLEGTEENFNEIIAKYKFFKEQVYSEYEGLSLFHIFEGMAHIFSIQLTDTSQNYLPLLEKNQDYHIAYNVFNSNISDDFQSLNIQAKHLVFLYICYFSCQVYDHIEDDTLERPSKLFHLLCSRLNLYLEVYLKLCKRYEQYDKNELLELNQFNIQVEHFKLATKTQISQIYAFFELIPCIEQDAEKYYRKISQDTLKTPEEFLKVFNNLNIDLRSIYQLAKFSIFPSSWADFWEAYDVIQETKLETNEFDISDEIAFFEFVENVVKIPKEQISLIPCCKPHGNVGDRYKILNCTNEGSLAHYLQQMTGREASELFKSPQ